MLVINGKQNGWIGSEYIGRPMPGRAGSALGNPFKTKAHTVEAHTEVVEQYRAWLWQQIKAKNPSVCGELNRLKQVAISGDLKFACWCKPLPCHGDVIANCINWMIQKDIEL